jgi:hypothetical protein
MNRDRPVRIPHLIRQHTPAQHVMIGKRMTAQTWDLKQPNRASQSQTSYVTSM